MRLGLSVPKKRPACGGTDGAAAPRLCSVREGIEEILRHTAGKALFLSDDTSFSAFAPAARSGRALAVLWEGDALPLFAMPDGTGCILAAGGEEVLRAARFFASARALPCALFPRGAALDGVFEASGYVRLDGVRRQVPLAAASVYCDLAAMHASLAEGYARLLLARLALFEARALELLGGNETGSEYETAFALLDPVRAELSPGEIVEKNAAMRLLERGGLPCGEGGTLARLHGGETPSWRAFCELSALYRALFESGVPRRYAVPDYEARAVAAGVSYADVRIPTPRVYAQRALALERVRGALSAELRRLCGRRYAYLRAMRAYNAAVPDCACLQLNTLKYLPEHAPDGLSAVVRDFGLMEWET